MQPKTKKTYQFSMKFSRMENRKHLTPFLRTNLLTRITINMTIIKITAMKFLTTLWEKLTSISSTHRHRYLNPNILVTVAGNHLIPVTDFFRIYVGNPTPITFFFTKKHGHGHGNKRNATKRKVITDDHFSTTVVENTGYTLKYWHYVILQFH